MLVRVPLNLPADVMKVGGLKTWLSLQPDNMLVVAERPGDDPQVELFTLGWAVRAHVLNESGQRVPVIGLPQVDPADNHVMTVALMSRVIADLPDTALPVTVWETDDGPLQTTIGVPKFGNLVDEASGVTVKVVVLPAVYSLATGDAYDDIVFNLGWE
ncbi:hypothetical protein [Kitasatospora griseola]